MTKKEKEPKMHISPPARYFLVERGDMDSFPVDWSRVPEDIADHIPGEFIYNVLSMDSKCNLEKRSVVYFAPVGPGIEIDGDDCLDIHVSKDNRFLVAIFKD